MDNNGRDPTPVVRVMGRKPSGDEVGFKESLTGLTTT